MTWILDSATLLTALATMFTVWEMNRQRKQAYKPDLAIDDSYNEVYYFQNNKDFAFYAPQYEDTYGNCKAEVVNLGFGVGKNIKWRIKFDSKKAEELIRITNPKRSFELDFFELPDYEGYSAKYNDFESSIHPEKEAGVISFIHTYESNKESKYILIPKLYMIMLSLYLNAVEDQDEIAFGFESINFKKFPSPEIELEYEDLAGTKTRKQFILEVNEVSIKTGQVFKTDGLIAGFQFSYIAKDSRK